MGREEEVDVDVEVEVEVEVDSADDSDSDPSSGIVVIVPAVVSRADAGASARTVHGGAPGGSRSSSLSPSSRPPSSSPPPPRPPPPWTRSSPRPPEGRSPPLARHRPRRDARVGTTRGARGARGSLHRTHASLAVHRAVHDADADDMVRGRVPRQPRRIEVSQMRPPPEGNIPISPTTSRRTNSTVGTANLQPPACAEVSRDEKNGSAEKSTPRGVRGWIPARVSRRATSTRATLPPSRDDHTRALTAPSLESGLCHVRRGGVHRGVQVLRAADRCPRVRPPLQRHHGPERLRQVQHPGLHLLRARHHQPLAGARSPPSTPPRVHPRLARATPTGPARGGRRPETAPWSTSRFSLLSPRAASTLGDRAGVAARVESSHRDTSRSPRDDAPRAEPSVPFPPVSSPSRVVRFARLRFRSSCTSRVRRA